MICVSLGKTDFHQALKITENAAMVEIRGDLLDWLIEDYARLIQASRKSVFTFRPDGKLSDADRLAIYRYAVENNVNYIDVEIEASSSFKEAIREMISNTKTELILSYHNFKITPSHAELKIIMDQCRGAGADVIKIATMVNDYADAADLLSLYNEAGRKVIIGMGEKGKIVRVASILLGAEFTFAAPGMGQNTAPGQLSLEEMEYIYKILKIL